MMKLDKKKKAGLMLIVIGLLLILMVVLSLMKKNEDTANESTETGNVYQEIPEATVPRMSDSKSEAYIEETSRRPSIVEHWDDCMETIEKDEEEQESTQQGHSGGGATNAELFGEAAPTTSSGSGSRHYDNPYRESHQEREERHRRRKEEAIEMAERMQNGGNTEKEHEDDAETEPKIIPAISSQSRPETRRSSVISSLDDNHEATGITSLEYIDESVCDDEIKPLKCMFSKGMKLRSGNRVSIILLEDMVIGGHFIPEHTHMMGVCRINNRLEIEIASIEMSGRIIPFGYEAYDIDGSKGIYCPDVGSEGKTIRSRGRSLVSSTLNSRMGRIAGDIVNTGVSIFQGRDGEKTVTVPTGYTFFIMKKQER